MAASAPRAAMNPPGPEPGPLSPCNVPFVIVPHSGPLVACSVLEYTTIGLVEEKIAESVALGDEKKTMALVLSSWGGPGRIADDSVCAWESSDDGYADQDPCRAGLGNEHARSNTHAPAQCDIHPVSVAFSDERAIQPQPSGASRHTHTDRHGACSFGDTHAPGSHQHGNPAGDRATAESTTSNGDADGQISASPSTSAGWGMGYGGRLCAWIVTAG